MKQWQEPKLVALGVEMTFGGDDGLQGDGEIFQVQGKEGKAMGLNSGIPWVDKGWSKVTP